MLVRERLGHLHSAAEERGVGPRQLVPQLDGEVDWANGSDALVFDLTAAALGLPPEALLRLAGVAVKRKPRRAAAGLLELDEELAAAGNGAVDAEFEPRHPTPHIVISLVGVVRPGGDLKGVFLKAGLIPGLHKSCWNRGADKSKTRKGDR